MTHKCRASGCKVHVDAKYLMCGWHWNKVPLEIRRAVNRYWLKKQIGAWRRWATRAVYAVAIAEGRVRQIMDGVYHDLVANKLHVETPLLCETFGWPQTRENLEKTIEIAQQVTSKLFPDAPQSVDRDEDRQSILE